VYINNHALQCSDVTDRQTDRQTTDSSYNIKSLHQCISQCTYTSSTIYVIYGLSLSPTFSKLFFLQYDTLSISLAHRY